MSKKKKNEKHQGPRQEMKIAGPVANVDYGGDSIPYRLPDVLPGVIPEKEKIACDAAIAPYTNLLMIEEGLTFLGYSYLAQLAQRAEYRRASEITAEYMTKNWLKLTSTGDENMDDKEDKLKQIEKELDKLKARDVFKMAALHDGLYGRAMVVIDTGGDDIELRTPLALTKSKIKLGCLKALKIVEPIWTYPSNYNSTDPLSRHFFKPQEWFILGRSIHATRTFQFVGRPVSDILKPAYIFGGLSMTQMAKPYVDNWLRTRQSVSDLVESFTVFILKTNMSSILAGGAAIELQKRAEMFLKFRGNHGLNCLDKDSEDFDNISVPLSGLDALQAQAQEHLCSVFGIPLVIFTGITPSGLNATSDGELRVFYDWIKAQQESLFSPNFEKLLKMVQLSLYGEIDPEIGFEWVPLYSLDEGELATVRKTNAETDITYLDAGVISPDEVRIRLANEEESLYAGLDLSQPLPEPPMPELPGFEDLSGLGEPQPPSQPGFPPVQDKSTSPAQKHFMAAAAHNPEFAAKADIPQSVAKEFNDADKQANDGWITVKGGESAETGESTGSLIFIGAGGEVKAGAGGKLNGKKFDNVKSQSSHETLSGGGKTPPKEKSTSKADALAKAMASGNVEDVSSTLKEHYSTTLRHNNYTGHGNLKDVSLFGAKDSPHIQRALKTYTSTIDSLHSDGYDIHAALEKYPVDFGLAKLTPDYGGLCHVYGKKDITLFLNGAPDKELDKGLQINRQRMESSGLTWTVALHPDNTPADIRRSTAIHELAHAVGNARDAPGRLKKTLLAHFGDKLKGVDDATAEKEICNWVKHTVSEYGATNINEANSEIAAMVTSPRYKKGSLPKVLEDHVAWLFSPKED